MHIYIKPFPLLIITFFLFFIASCSFAENEENLGHRFIIEGDFDGDGKKEKIQEYYYSQITNVELNKQYPYIQEYDVLVEHIMAQKPALFLLSDNNKLDTFFATKEAQSWGFLYLKNEGDLNGDGIDEISYIVDWADFSALNTCHIITYRNNKWEELYRFDIWDWLVPPYAKIQAKDTATLKELNAEYKHFQGLIKALQNNTIQVLYMNEDAALDSMQVTIQ